MGECKQACHGEIKRPSRASVNKLSPEPVNQSNGQSSTWVPIGRPAVLPEASVPATESSTQKPSLLSLSLPLSLSLSFSLLPVSQCISRLCLLFRRSLWDLQTSSLGLKRRAGWRQACLRASGKVRKHPARDPASQRGATPTSQPASQRSNQLAKQSLDKSAIRKPLKQLWLPNTVSLSLSLSRSLASSLSLSLSLFLSLSLSPSLCPSVCRKYTGGGHDRRQASKQPGESSPANPPFG